MAALLDEMTYVSFPITKVSRTDDGDIEVYGIATDGSVDSDDQIVDPGWSSKALGEWLSTGGNVRVMHSAQHLPAGKGLTVDSSASDGSTWVRSLVVEPTAKMLVEKGVLQAYSIGIMHPRIVIDAQARGGRIVGGMIHELSLVDRPANASCKIALVKMAGGVATELEEPTVTGDLPLAYESARGSWLAREPRHAGCVTGTDFLAKHAAWRIEGDGAGLSTPEGRHRWMAKAVDPDVGGGVDRDELKDSDFVFPDERKFPIVTPDDVPDAVSSWGRYKGSKSFDEFKSRLTALCRRKGASFLAKLPESWNVTKGAEMAETNTLEAPEDAEVDKAAKPRDDDKPASDGANDAGGGNEADAAEAEDPDAKACGDDDDAKCKTADGDTVVKAKNCPDCHAEYHNDSKLRRCSECGAKLPQGSDKAVDDDTAATKSVPTIPGPGPLTPGMHREPDGHVVEALETQVGVQEPDEHEVPDRIPASALKGHMQAAHDALIASCPDLCSVAVKVLVEPVEPVVTVVETPTTKAAGPALISLDDVSVIVKSAVAEVTATYTAQLDALRAQLDELGSQPDPALAPLRGVVAKTAAMVAPVERVSLAAAQAERQKTEYADWLRTVAGGHADPAMRQNAEAALRKLFN